MRRFPSASILGLFTVVGACSLINAPDDVVTDTVQPSGGAPDGHEGGAAGADTTPRAGSTSQGGAGASAGLAGAGAGAGGDSPVGRPEPTRGLLLAAGTDDAGLQGLIAVIDPVDGTELSREKLKGGAQVAGLAYDGAPTRDVWFVFLATDFPADPTKTADLEVRYFDDVSNSWQQLSKVTALPPPQPDTLAVLNGRLAYLSYRLQGNTTTSTLTVLDTSDLEHVQAVQLEQPPIPAASTMIGLLGTRGAVGDPDALGGTLNLALRSGCVGGTGVCSLSVLPITVGNNVSAGVATTLGNYQGTLASVDAKLEPLNLYALPPPAAGQVTIARVDPRSPEDAETSSPPTSTRNIGGLVLAECQRAALLTSGEGNSLFGITLVGIGGKRDLGRPGQKLIWEPFTTSVYAPFDPSGQTGAGGAGGAPSSGIDAFDVKTNASGTSLAISPRGGWVSPSDLLVNALAVRFPTTYQCP